MVWIVEAGRRQFRIRQTEVGMAINPESRKLLDRILRAARSPIVRGPTRHLCEEWGALVPPIEEADWEKHPHCFRWNCKAKCPECQAEEEEWARDVEEAEAGLRLLGGMGPGSEDSQGG
jgi:hypothetical protein